MSAATDTVVGFPGRSGVSDVDSAEINDTDLANAKRFVARFGADVRFTPEKGWLVWDGRRWDADEKGLSVQRMATVVAASIFDELRSSTASGAPHQVA